MAGRLEMGKCGQLQNTHKRVSRLDQASSPHSHATTLKICRQLLEGMFDGGDNSLSGYLWTGATKLCGVETHKLAGAMPPTGGSGEKSVYMDYICDQK